jgi:hypothetical protein
MSCIVECGQCPQCCSSGDVIASSRSPTRMLGYSWRILGSLGSVCWADVRMLGSSWEMLCSGCSTSTFHRTGSSFRENE